MKIKRILLTGAAGFIGFHLAQKLHARGDFVIGVDNYNHYYDPHLKQERNSHLAKMGVKIEQGEIQDGVFLKNLIEKHQVTHLVHLAAQAGVRYSLINPQAYIDANISGFLQILETCRTYPHLVLTYASSSSVYGNNVKIPFSVEDPTNNQASFYGVTKKSNELMAQTYHHLYGIKVTGLRFFTVYGPWGRPDMAYFSFADAIVQGKSIDLYNFGAMQRDFTYIDDIIDGTVAAIDLEAEQELFNLGNHRPEPLLALVEALEKSLGKKAITRLLPMQPGDVVSTYADISHSEERLGFTPKIPLEEGIDRFVSWYKKGRFPFEKRPFDSSL